MIAYVVVSGSYSDFGISAIFSTKELADDFVDRMNFVDSYYGDYRIQEWEMDKIPTEIPTNDLCLYNEEVVKLDDLNGGNDFDYSAYIAYCIFSNLQENTKSRVLEITKEDYLKELLDNNIEDNEIDINKVQFPIYCVQDVKYNKDKSVMYKSVYDEIAKFKAEKEGL